MNPSQDALELLAADHEHARQLFAAFRSLCERGAPDADKAEVVEEICFSSRIHAQVVSEIFHPALNAAMGDNAMFDEAQAEYARVGAMVAKLSAMRPADPRYDAEVTALGVVVEHHVELEQGGMFSQARASNIDLLALAAAIRARKSELLACDADPPGALAQEDESGDPVGARSLASGPEGVSQALPTPTPTAAANVKDLAQQNVDFTSEGSPPPGQVATSIPATPDMAPGA